MTPSFCCCSASSPLSGARGVTITCGRSSVPSKRFAFDPHQIFVLMAPTHTPHHTHHTHSTPRTHRTSRAHTPPPHHPFATNTPHHTTPHHTTPHHTTPHHTTPHHTIPQPLHAVHTPHTDTVRDTPRRTDTQNPHTVVFLKKKTEHQARFCPSGPHCQ